MKVIEIGTGYTSIPAKISAATEIVIEQLTKAFIRQGVAVEIVDIADSNRVDTDLPLQEVMIPEMFVDADVQLGIMHKLKRVVYSIALATKLKKILKDMKETTVLHFHNQYNLFFFLKLVPKSLRKKSIIVYTNHSGIWRLDWNQIEGVVKKRYFQEIECMRKADIVFALNRETIQNAVKHIGAQPSRFALISNGVDTDIYHVLCEEEKRKAKEKFGLKNRKVFLQVGSVYENKGQLRMISYLKPVLENHPDCLYAYVVSEEYQKRIENYVNSNDLTEQVKYFGMICPGTELNKLYNCAEATVFSSQYEAFSLVIIESMAAGVPVLISKETPFSLGDGCILYDEESFVRVVEECVLNTEILKRYAKQARETAVEQYSWAKIAKNYMCELEKRNIERKIAE